MIYLLNNKTTLYHNEFDNKYFKEGWHQCFSNYRDDDIYNIGHKLACPVICRMYFRWSKIRYHNCSGSVVNR